MKNIKLLLTFAFSLCAVMVSAQTRISGHVFHATDGPVVMATVVEISPDNRNISATQTDANGDFSFNVQDPVKNKLKISYIGYQTVTRAIGTQTSFQIEMKDRVRENTGTAVVTAVRKVKSNGLDIPQREISVARQTLDMDDMEGLSFETAGEALQGQIAGLDIVMNSGNLGAGTSMRLRGVSTINGSQEPLIVVDGYILEDYDNSELDLNNMDNDEQFANLLQINPEDIKKIDVLKDASATAIWGSRGANGVIEITTRRGARGKTRVNFSYRFSGSWQPEGMKMLNGKQYTMMLQQAYFNPQQSEVASGIVELMYLQSHPAYYANFNKNTDWVDEVTQFGQTHNFGVAIQGGGEKATFRVSANYDHETGSIIAQKLDRFTTRLALDYYVSDRIKFSSNFSLAYTKNHQNYTGILAAAYKAMPNMSIYRYEYDRETETYYNTGEYFIMPRASSTAGLLLNNSGLSSYYMSDMVTNGNPVASAYLAWRNVSSYTITPQFQIEYKLLGKEDDEFQLNYTGEVYMNAQTQSTNAYYPQSLTYLAWNENVNQTGNSEGKNLSFTTRHSFVIRPHFNNEKHSLQVLLRGEIGTSNSTSQTHSSSGINGGITSSVVKGYLMTASSGTGKGHSASGLGSIHYAYGGKYMFDFTLRADGNTKFGKGEKWGFFPGISGRWNISDEKWFKPLKKVVSMLGFRPGYGINGNTSAISETSQYNTYGPYGSYNGTSGIVPNNLRLTTIKYEKTKSWNIGVNLGLFNDMINFDLNVYNKKTTDLLNSGVSIPSVTGFSTLSAANVGSMENEGWELYINTGPLLKRGKFHMNLRFNIAQNINTITSMDATVLEAANTPFSYTDANQYIMQRVQIGNALGGIYGFRFKGVYAYDYDHNGYFLNDTKNQYPNKEGVWNGNTAAYTGLTAPIAYDANGNIIYDKSGNPLPMYFNYGGQNYQFQGGDVIYEDINHDGNIDDLDIVYLGGSNPKCNGGFGIDFTYGQWQLRTNFNFRIGNKIINQAKMNAESMQTNNNQMASVNWRWRRNGDVTVIPRAMNKIVATYNSMVSDRYVENGDFCRFNYAQLSYSVPSSKLKKYGLSSLRMSLSGNNLIFWSKYSGVDPEHGASGYYPCVDNSQTPRSRSFTFSLNFGF